ncbi:MULTISPECIES: thioredoxin family protein [Butyricimonas]|uniref:thioredoxin family protein n=1 Tax=Butyricimonas TaxID=574697 RepID=UPI0007FB596D|nr:MULTISPECIES: thioredoxin family protein [Butyricimonas]
MLKRNALYVCVLLLLSLTGYAGELRIEADSSQLEDFEKRLLRILDDEREKRGITLPEVNFDLEQTRVGYAYLMFDSLMQPGGMYAINLDNPQEYKLIGEPNYYSVWGGTFAEDKYYAYVAMGGGANQPVGFYSIDLHTGWRTRIANYEGRRDIPLLGAMAYDPVSREIIGLHDQKMYSVDRETGKMKQLALMDRGFMTFAISKDGVMYGIDRDGNLCQINRQGGVRIIGFTGIQTWGMQSMTFNSEDGKLYWAMWSDEVVPALCVVDLETGKAVRVADMGHRSEWNGFYIPTRRVEGTPGKMENLTFIPDQEECAKGILRWESFTVNHPDLSKVTKIEIFRDGKLLKTLKGSMRSFEDVSIPFGEHVYRVVAWNKFGEGESTCVRVFVGADVPAAVTNVKFVRDSATRGKITWEPVTKGRNGGMLDASFLRYHVYRFPGNEKILVTSQTQFIDNVYQPNCYYYGIQPETEAGMGEIAYSNKLVSGNSFPVPYSCNFAESEGCLWTVLDKLGNGKNWYLVNQVDNFCLAYESPRKGNHEDDLLISPALFLKEGHFYRLKFDVKIFAGRPSVHVTFGEHPTAESQREIFALDSLKNMVYRTYEIDLPRVSKRAGYHIGFQNYSTEGEGRTGVFITNVRVCEIVDPELAVKLEKVPSIDNDGETLLFVGYQMPNLSGGKTLDAQPFNLYGMGGKLKLLDVWGAANKNYLGNRAEIRNLYKDFHAKGLNVVSISCDTDREAVASAIKEYQMEWPQIAEFMPWQNNVFAQVLYLQGLPCVILLDENNRVLAFVQDAKQLRPLIKSLLTDDNK